MDEEDTRTKEVPELCAAQGFRHDLLNLMCVISHQSELGQRAQDLGAEDLRKILGRIHDVARLTIELIEREASGSDDPDVFDLRALIVRVAKVARGRAKQSVQVRCVLPDDPVWIEGRADALLRICLNLALNAVDASPEGKVTLSVSVQADAPAAVDLAAGKLPQPSWVLLDVTDSGPGVPDDLRTAIWDSGVTSKGTNGSGVGLALVRRLIEDAGAGIALQSKPSGGSVFRVYWPAAAIAAGQSRNPSGQS